MARSITELREMHEALSDAERRSARFKIVGLSGLGVSGISIPSAIEPFIHRFTANPNLAGFMVRRLDNVMELGVFALDFAALYTVVLDPFKVLRKVPDRGKGAIVFCIGVAAFVGGGALSDLSTSNFLRGAAEHIGDLGLTYMAGGTAVLLLKDRLFKEMKRKKTETVETDESLDINPF